MHSRLTRRDGEDDPGALNGTYQVEWAVDELTALGVPGDVIDEFEMAGVFTWVLTDGELHFTGELAGGDGHPVPPGTGPPHGS